MTVYADHQAKEQARLTTMAQTCLHNCGGNLSVAWDGAFDIHALRCGKCQRYVAEPECAHQTSELVKRWNLTERWRAGDTLPLIIENHLENKYRREVMAIKSLSEIKRFEPLPIC